MHIKLTDSISGLTLFGKSSLWQFCENYLDYHRTTHRVTFSMGSRIQLQRDISTKNIFLITLKVATYTSIVLPLFALFTRTLYRKKYILKVLDISPQFNTYHSTSTSVPSKEESPLTKLKDKLSEFKINYITFVNDTKRQNLLEKLAAGNINKENDSNLNLQKNLEKYLLDMSSYVKNQEEVVLIIDHALRGLIEKKDEHSDSEVEFAKQTYKKMSSFLRNHTEDKYKIRYEQSNYYQYGGANPSAFLNLGEQMTYTAMEGHCSVMYLLKHLRKQIKLTDKKKLSNKLQENYNNNTVLTPGNVSDRAINYLDLTWLHGTKAYVIKSACEKTSKELLPMGTLKKRNVQILTGEMANGAKAIGINQASLSGVSLAYAMKSINYSNWFKLNINDELIAVEQLLSQKFESFGDLTNSPEIFCRRLEALKRIKTNKPEEFNQKLEALKVKLNEMYTAVNREVYQFERREIFNWHDCCYISDFYNFISSLEEFEELIYNPIDGQSNNQEVNAEDIELGAIGIVVASRNKYGIPITLSYREQPFEEAYPGALKLGEDIQVVFTEDKNIGKVKELLERYQLNSVQVESMEVLEAASKIDHTCASHFFDVYNLRKWKKM